MQFWNITFATLDGMCGRCVEGKLSWHSSSPIYVGVPSMRRVCESTPKVWEEICLILTPLRVPAFVFSIPSGLRKFRQNEVMEINQIVVGTQSLNLTHRKSSRKTFWKSNHISHKQKEKPVRSNKHMTSQLKMLQHHGSWKGHVRKRKNPKVEMTSAVQIVELPPNLLRWGFIVFLSCFRFFIPFQRFSHSPRNGEQIGWRKVTAGHRVFFIVKLNRYEICFMAQCDS